MDNNNITQTLKWEEDTKFELSGTEFSQMHNTLKMIVESPLYQQELQKAKLVAGIGQMFELSSRKLQEGYKDGRVVVVEPDSPEVHQMD